MHCTWLLFPCYFLFFFVCGGRAVFLPLSPIASTLVWLVDLSVKSFVYIFFLFLDYFVLLNKFDLRLICCGKTGPYMLTALPQPGQVGLGLTALSHKIGDIAPCLTWV